MKHPYHCTRCDYIKWSAALKAPKCPNCKKPMDLTSKAHCNCCGRELINQQEDRCGLCKVCQ